MKQDFFRSEFYKNCNLIANYMNIETEAVVSAVFSEFINLSPYLVKDLREIDPDIIPEEITTYHVFALAILHPETYLDPLNRLATLTMNRLLQTLETSEITN